MIIMDTPHLDGYEFGPKIGGGSFSTVFRACQKNVGSERVAIKCIHRGKRAGTEIAVTEIMLMKSLTHTNIVKFHDFSSDSKYIYIIMEFCSEGDLSRLIKQRYKLVENLVQMFMQQLALAMKYLRQHNLCHMDLKPQNLLLTRTPGLTLKVADFGLSRILSESNLEQCRFAGSIRYMAPEKLLNMKYDCKIDLWAIGVIMFECLVGRTPFSNLNHKGMCEFMALQKPMPIPSSVSISPMCEDLLYRLLRYNQYERIGFEAFFNHEFLNMNFLPCQENFEEVRKLMIESIELERDRKYKQAMDVCQRALGYLEGFVNNEPNKEKRRLLLDKLEEYRQFEEKLIISINCPQNAGPLMNYDAILTWFRGSPQVATAIEIGASAEMFYAEGRRVVAFEKFKAALDILMSLLQTEPSGPRKELLCRQINKWLTYAETIKASF